MAWACRAPLSTGLTNYCLGLLAAIEPHYPKKRRGRPPIGQEWMLRIDILQQRCGPPDEAQEDALYDSMEMRTFARIDLAFSAFRISMRMRSSGCSCWYFVLVIHPTLSGWQGVALQI
ncbi:hypothetical protein A9975_25040 [Cupriavidus sp. UME77]|nr:hypothetical protein [Cupriavidus sp. UME77]